jgi:hypothetical protein
MGDVGEAYAKRALTMEVIANYTRRGTKIEVTLVVLGENL